MFVWLNGAVMEEGAILLSSDRGFLLGDGAFETVRVEQGRALFVERHARRLRDGLFLLGIEPPAHLGLLEPVISDLGVRNGLGRLAAARVTVSRGVGGRGLGLSDVGPPTMLVTTSPVTPPPSSRRMIVSRQHQRPLGPLSAVKLICGYGPSLAALAEAKSAGADDVLLLNPAGRIACAGAANIYVIARNGQVSTPAINEGALGGVVRGLLLEAVPDNVVGQLPLAALADSMVVLSNCLIGVQDAEVVEFTPPVVSWSDAQVAAATRLRSAFEEACRAAMLTANGNLGS